jgi:hypothetical protein
LEKEDSHVNPKPPATSSGCSVVASFLPELFVDESEFVVGAPEQPDMRRKMAKSLIVMISCSFH